MKKTLFLLGLVFLAALATSQSVIDEVKFKSQFQEMINQSIKGFDLQSPAPDMEGASSNMYWNEESSGKISYVAIYRVESEEVGIELKRQLADWVESSLPSEDFKRSTTYGPAYFDYVKFFFEFNSDVYAEQRKRPQIEIGVKKEGDHATVQFIIYQPFFPNQYQPNW